eukprot:TRINITY_DN5407_c0_g1_i6.p1 TRINITY_DN5407_c0_g1~~TRINITY_DN5407_c0_g1_i6.p1  ORF type:complete len:283 (-),score=72.78 TRINITY_DN5407_c0_g1_i6:663-1511(-)
MKTSYHFAVKIRNNVAKISFLDCELLESFMYEFVDMDGDGVITNADLELFLGTMPNELGLILDSCTKEERIITSREYLLRIKLRKHIKTSHKIVHVRGNNYETINHQLPFIAKTIMSAFSEEENNEITSKDMFRGWLAANLDLLEYWFDTVCPLGWISQMSIERTCFRKAATEYRPTPLQRAIQLLYAKNEKAFAYYISENKLPEEVDYIRKKKSSPFCCDCMKSSKVSPETYVFERDWIKKDELTCVKDQKPKKCTLLYKYNCLYILSGENKVSGSVAGYV